MMKYLVNKANESYFPFFMWLSSRIIIWVSMLGIAPLLPQPVKDIRATFSWDVFIRFDCNFYLNIVEHGYQFANDEKGYNVAFFPLYPTLIYFSKLIGFEPKIAGIIISNTAFLIALIILFHYLAKKHDINIAKWTIAFLSFCPISLYCSVVYTEGLFLCLSTLTLTYWTKPDVLKSSIFGMLLTATRLNSLAIIPTYLIVCWQEKRKLTAYIAALLTGLGLIFYMGYLKIKFDQPLAFLLVQKAWNQEGHEKLGYLWLKIFLPMFFGWANYKSGRLVDIIYPLIFALGVGLIYYCWWKVKRTGNYKFSYGMIAGIIVLWLLSGDEFFNSLLVFGGAYLLWHYRQIISPTILFYGIFSLFIIFATGRTMSINRFAYGCVSLAICWGIFLSRHVKLNYFIILWFIIMLITSSIRFAQGLWVA